MWVGSHYLFDDLWHDLYCNNLDTLQAGRPLEFHALDLFTANKFAWGTKIRLERQDGTMEGLNEREMRLLLAYMLRCHGYSLRGTALVVEHGTAAIRSDVEAMLYDLTGGLITVERGSIKKSGLATAAHQYAGRTKGNFRIKAALESYGNLIHNETAFLLGQTGMDVAYRPEQTHGLLKENDALLTAISQLHPEQIELLRLPLLTIQQLPYAASFEVPRLRRVHPTHR